MDENIVVDSSISLNHIGRVIDLIGEIPYFAERNARVERIENLPGGLTNNNFKVTIDGEKYALRLAGAGTLEYLDRVAEKNNAGLMSDMKINARIIYYDGKTGNQVCEYIDGKTLHIADFRNPGNIKQAARIFRKYHTCGEKFLSEFDPVKVIDEYNALLAKKKVNVFDGYEQVRARVDEIRNAFMINPQTPAPSHNDPLPENFLVDHRGMWLIDWEYSGMTDPMFDLGDFSVEVELNKEEELLFLEEYFGGTVTLGKYALVVIHKFLCDVLWSVWALLQIATGKPAEEYWPYGLNRFNRCVRLMNDENFDRYIQAVRDNSEEVCSAQTSASV